MTQLTNSSSIAALITSLQELEGINQKADLVASLISRAITANIGMSMTTLTGLAGKGVACIPSNIPKGTIIDGVTGIAPILPAEYLGRRIQMTRTLVTYYPMYDFMTCITADNNTLYFIAYAVGRHVWKYNILTGVLTDMGWFSTSASAICMSDDGSNIYMAETTGALYKWGGSSWVLLPNVNVQNAGAYKTMTCNNTGTEIYYFNNVGYICKYVVSTNIVTIISTNLTYVVNCNMLYWCDDNSLWLSYNSGNGMLKNIKISDATVLKTFTSLYSLSFACMTRSSISTVRGTVTERNGSSSGYLCIVNSDGSRTQITALPINNTFVVGSLTGKYVLTALALTIFAVFQMDSSLTAIYSMPITSGVGGVYVTEDLGRLADQNGNQFSNYLYQ